ncbi:hypothetical protein [Ruminococcus sp.]|uniref:hypothetical protein n=1 Tax=Ruminococcus sp. TaxID=41978 RepID=UPI002E794CA0|nr:hypothetical protein [Ruminococcus sp.]MEE0740591.1 hypothetical protein [Ruminococcus sp.]
MKSDKLKRYVVRFAIAFFLILAVLTYFSSTIDNMLLPKVKVTELSAGSLEENYRGMETRYLVPLSAVSGFGDSGTLYIINEQDPNKPTITEYSVAIHGSDNLFYEVSGSRLWSGMQVVYSTSKDISNGDRVYIEEE